jgi:inner membrane protein
MGLKRLSPRAMPTLILAANLPDVDSFVAGALGCDPLAAHRGFTHGIGGLVTMPFLAVAIIFAGEKLFSGNARALKLRGLILVSFLGVLSHPLLDLMNTYGVRLLEPFSHQWFYGDTLFIADPWIWIMLILGLEFSWRAERLERDWTRPAAWAFTAMLLYVGLNCAISARSAALVRPMVERVAPARMIVAGEVPLEFWKRQIAWRGDAVGGTGEYNLLGGLDDAHLDPELVPLRLDDPRLRNAEVRDPHVRAFLFWSRMPLVIQSGGHAYLTDQRFYDESRRPGSSFMIPLDNPKPSS